MFTLLKNLLNKQLQLLEMLPKEVIFNHCKSFFFQWNQDAVVARQYSDNQKVFRLTAQHWASAYAGASYSNPEYNSLLKRLEDMGVHKEAARVALSSCSWDINRATEQLFN